MITLHSFGPFMGTPDASPFVMKVMVLLKIAGLPHRIVRGNPVNGPHRLLPYIVDGELTVPDSTLIRLHIERKYGLDFDAALAPHQRAMAWAVERMCEDHLYFALLEARWLDSGNFKSGLGRYMFGQVPAPARPLVKAVLRRMNAKRLQGHGLGRHGTDDIFDLARRDIDALAATLADKRYLMGDSPCAADATAWAMTTAILTPPLNGPLREAMAARANLVGYRDRLFARFFPDARHPERTEPDRPIHHADT
jgi:glutathione S-transferase